MERKCRFDPREQIPPIPRIAAVETEKTLIIRIEAEDLQILKDSNFKLCFAKNVEGIFDVVWRASEGYLSINQFDWSYQYQLFCSNSFADNEKVRSTTEFRDIDFGQESTLNDAGILSPPSTGGEENKITLVNEYGSIHPGLSQMAVGVDGKMATTPTYLAENAVVQGTYGLTTAEMVLVWFEQDVETGTMFTSGKSNGFEVDMTSVEVVELLYQNQTWSLEKGSSA